VEDPDVLNNIASAYWQLGNYEQSISSLEEAILLSNEELYLKRSLLKKKYLSNNIGSNQYVEQLSKLLDKSESYRDSLNTYHKIKNHYVHLGHIKKSYEYVEKISDMHRKKYGRISSMNTLLNKHQINIFKHLNMMDSVKIYLDYYAENSVAPYDNRVPYVKCIYYLYMENYDMLAATIDDAEDGYAEF
jgi:tetratricopeptide (TPR) repeat protein